MKKMLFAINVGKRLADGELEFYRSVPEFDAVTSKFGPDVMKFIVLCYDKNSDFVARYPSMQRRKEEVMNATECRQRKAITTMYEYEGIMDALFRYLFMQDDRLWMQICLNGNLFLEYMKEVAKPLTDTRDDKQRIEAMNVKAKAAELMEDIDKRINAMMTRFTGGDDEASKAFNTFKRITPEAVAKMNINV